MKILPSQRNKMFDILIAEGLNPMMFGWSESSINIVIADGPSTRLDYKGTNFFFEFSKTILSGTQFYLKYSPAGDEYEVSKNVVDWFYVISEFEVWARSLFSETQTPDKWLELQKQLEGGAKFKADEDDKYKFSVAEYEDLKYRMQGLKEGIKKLALPPEQLKLIEAKLDHLTEAAKDMNKFDWKGLFIGSIAGVIVQLAMPASASGMLWELIKHAFSNILMP